MNTARIAELLEPFLVTPIVIQDESSIAEEGPLHSEALRTRGGPAALSPSQLKRISMYIDILCRWNVRINLTAIRDPEEIVTRHFGESLFAARHLFPDGRSAGERAIGEGPTAGGRSDRGGTGDGAADASATRGGAARKGAADGATADREAAGGFAAGGEREDGGSKDAGADRGRAALQGRVAGLEDARALAPVRTPRSRHRLRRRIPRPSHQTVGAPTISHDDRVQPQEGRVPPRSHPRPYIDGCQYTEYACGVLRPERPLTWSPCAPSNASKRSCPPPPHWSTARPSGPAHRLRPTRPSPNRRSQRFHVVRPSPDPGIPHPHPADCPP